MKLRINSKTPLNSIKEKFNKAYPGLKLEFFHHGHSEGAPSAKGDMVTEDKLAGDLNKKLDEHFVEVNASSNVSVGDFEAEMASVAKLNVQVFRHSGRAWIETTATDHWTLEKQNKEGEANDQTWE